MRRSFAVVAVLALIGSASAFLPPGLTPDEAACERAFGPATDAFGAAIAACVVRCDAKAARGKLPQGACLAPYDSTTQACIERARGREARHISRGCRADCPECYGGDCATFGHDALVVTGQVVDGLVRRVLCDDAASGDGLSAAESRCQRAAGVALARAARAFGACFVQCRRFEERARSEPLVSCTASPAGVQIRSVVRCLDRVRRRAIDAVGRRCGNPPECLADPTTIVDVVEEQIRSDYDVLIFCASPSGAFVP